MFRKDDSFGIGNWGRVIMGLGATLPNHIPAGRSEFMKNVEKHAIFVEGFSPEFYACGRFMKYSMSGITFTCYSDS